MTVCGLVVVWWVARGQFSSEWGQLIDSFRPNGGLTLQKVESGLPHLLGKPCDIWIWAPLAHWGLDRW